ncbi:MAG: AI-2E family transporter [Acidimicrobiia bacterium]|nr:AI-2E family transporter [Acidimicrobiia bacterium]
MTTDERRGFFDAAGMPPWIPRVILMVMGAVVALFVALNVFRALRGLLVLVVISVFLSIALEPGVNYLARRGWKRGAATGVIFGIALLVIVSFIALMVPLVIDQAVRLVDNVPSYIDQLAEMGERFGIELSGERLDEALSNVLNDLESIAGDIAGSIFGVGTALLATILQLLTIALFTFYLTADGPRFRRLVISLFRPDRQREILRMIDIAIDKTGGYFYSRALLAGFAASVAWATFTIIGVPFAAALALWLGVLSQFVPVVGTYIGGLLPLLVAFIESPARGIAVLVFIVVYQQLENYLLAPRITARTMELHPAVAFGAAIAGGTLLGAPGALMALPFAATVQAFISTYVHCHEVVASHLTDDPESEPLGVDE